MAVKKKAGFNMGGEWRQAASDMKAEKKKAEKKAEAKKKAEAYVKKGAAKRAAAFASTTKTSRGMDSRSAKRRVSGASEWADAVAQKKAKKSAARSGRVAPPKRSGGSAR